MSQLRVATTRTFVLEVFIKATAVVDLLVIFVARHLHQGSSAVLATILLLLSSICVLEIEVKSINNDIGRTSNTQQYHLGWDRILRVRTKDKKTNLKKRS